MKTCDVSTSERNYVNERNSPENETVTIPPARGAAVPGQPTGIVGNTAADPNAFVVSEGTKSGKAISSSRLLMARSMAGIPKLAGPALALMPPSRPTDQAPALFTRDSRSGSTERRIFYTPPTTVRTGELTCSIASFNVVQPSPNAFADPKIAREFAPYGIQNINGDIWVTYTALNKGQGGFVDRFAADGELKQHFAVHGHSIHPGGWRRRLVISVR
jgi:hypothetical protein